MRKVKKEELKFLTAKAIATLRLQRWLENEKLQNQKKKKLLQYSIIFKMILRSSVCTEPYENL